MTKSERLMFIISMLRTRQTLTISQIVAECEVTERTVYRDLSSLSRMNIPVYYDNGYRLAREVPFPSVELSAEDLELLCLSLHVSPLAVQPHYARRFRQIERKLRERIRHQSGYKRSVIVVTDSPETQESVDPDDFAHVADFLSAIFRSAVISIRQCGSKESQHWVPVAIRIRGNVPYFVVSSAANDLPIEIAASQVAAMTVTGKGVRSRVANRDEGVDATGKQTPWKK